MTTDFRIYLLTWNVGETFPPKDLTKLLGLNGKNLPNLYAVGLQEMKSSTASRVSDLVFEDIWTSAVTDCLSTRNYVRIKMRRLLGIHISVYVRRVDLPYVTNVESECTKTGLGGFWGNKGALSIRLDAFGVNICIVNAHFTAHAENFRQRLEDYNLALETQRFRDKNSETILDHDYIFWMGDLNFRTEGISNEETRKRAKEKDFEYLSKYDQLTKAVKEELIFIDFLEGPLEFPPTFKYDVGTDDYDSSTKNRVPSYCDRVLWRVHEDSYEGVDLAVEQLSYGCVMDEKSSDHKPVFAEFIIQVLKSPPELPVMFEPMGGWCQHKDNEVSYLVSSSLALNSRDWIGLYREGYKNWLDYTTYVWASVKGEDMHDGSHMHTVSFESRYLQRLPSDTYYLLYFSFIKNCVVGYSDGFRLLTTEESSASLSEVEVEAEEDLKPDECDHIDGFSPNASLNSSNFSVDPLDSEPVRTIVQPADEEEAGRRSDYDEDEELGQECSLLEHVEPDRSIKRQREPVITGKSEIEKLGESQVTNELKQQILSELPKVDGSNHIPAVSGEVTEPVCSGEEMVGLDETPLSVLVELDKSLDSELDKLSIAETEKPLPCELNRPALKGLGRTTVDEPEKPSCLELKESNEPEFAEQLSLVDQKQPVVSEITGTVLVDPKQKKLDEQINLLNSNTEPLAHTGSMDTLLMDTWSMDTGSVDTGSMDIRSMDTKSLDSVSMDTGLVDTVSMEPVVDKLQIILDNAQPVPGELVNKRPAEQLDREMVDPRKDGSLLKDLCQSSQPEEPEKHDQMLLLEPEHCSLGKQDLLVIPCDAEPIKSKQVTDKTREQSATSAEHGTSPLAEAAQRSLADQFLPCAQLDRSDPEKFAGFEERYCEASQLEQPSTELSEAAEIVRNAIRGALNELTVTEQSTSQEVSADEQSELLSNAVPGTGKSLH